MVPLLQPRHFSIASSQLAHPRQLHLCVAVVKFKTPYKRVRTGVCSSWLAQLREGDLVPQVAGAVEWVSPALASGGFFDAGEVLLRIDPADYEVALESARAQVARAESEFDRATKELARQKRLAARSVASQALFDDATNRERIAAAALEAGAEIVDRPAELADDLATVDSAVRHAVEAACDEASIVVLLYGNIPVRPPGLVDRAIDKLVETGA